MTTWATLHRRASAPRLRTLAALAMALIAAGSVTVWVIGRSDHRPVGVAAQIPACATGVAVSAPATDLAAVVNQEPEGTCFLLAAGAYRFQDVVPKNGMAFVGASTATVIVTGAGQENAFHGRADRVTIAQMTFTGFDGSGGTSRQEQAPIRGTAALWASNRGELATNWLIADVISEHNYASGIFLGDNWTVRNSIFRDNAVTGIGGDSLVGGLIEGNIIHGNGAQGAGGADANGGGIKLTQAGTVDRPVTVHDNELYDNEKIAIWCDLGCNGVAISDNYIHDHVSRAVMYELSSNLVVRNNTILRSNTWTDFGDDFNAGAITLGESADALVENNRITEAKSGVIIRQTKRPYPGENFNPYPGVTLVSARIIVRNNTLTNVANTGISTGKTGGGMITDPASIVFTGNLYDAPGSMSFWWNNKAQQNFGQWQADGRDVDSVGAPAGPAEPRLRGPGTGDAGDEPTTTTTAASTSTAPPTTAASSTTTTAAPATSESTTSTTAAPDTTEAPTTSEAPTTPTTASTTTEAPTTTTTASTTTSTSTVTTADRRLPKRGRWIRHHRRRYRRIPTTVTTAATADPTATTSRSVAVTRPIRPRP